jgi:AbrB family looped-hinge helix DNA binding protein
MADMFNDAILDASRDKDPDLGCHAIMAMVFLNGMKDVLVPIDKAGRVVLPKHVRDELAINAGDLLRISIHENEVTLRPTKEASGFIKRGHALVFSSGGVDDLRSDTVEAIRAEERGGLLSSLAKGLASPTHR